MTTTRAAGAICIGLWLLLLALWLRSIALGAPAMAVERAAIAAAAVASLAWPGVWLGAALRGGDRRRAGRALLLTGIALGSIAFAWVGIGHEVAEHYYQDEGIYLSHATRINAGELFRPRFVYPHLLFYIDALVLWCAERWATTLAPLVRIFAGLEDWEVARWLLLRLVAATMGGLTALPVFLAAERLAGRRAALLAALLIVFSPAYSIGFHVNTSDVPSAFFAALCLMAVARLLRGESLGGYLGAGAAAGLAAATKYPAGVVAVAIIAAWLRGRLRDRRFSWSLAASGLIAVATFLLCTPSLFVFPGVAWGGAHGIFFGWRQYGEGGWVGVMHDSNAVYYARELSFTFGLPALTAGLLGLVFLPRRQRGDLLWLAAFPIGYLALITSMSMVVPRNLYPVLPALAILLGSGLGGLAARLASALRRPAARRLAPAAVLAGALALPVFRTVAGSVAYARPSTRQLAAAWVEERLPAGATILKEGYTPHLRGKPFQIVERRFAAWIPLERARSKEIDYAILSPRAYDRFLDRSLHREEHQESYARWYEEVLREYELLVRFWPSPWRRGPRLEVYRAMPREIRFLDQRTFLAQEAVTSSRTMRDARPGLVYRRPTQWSLFKEFLAAGAYELELEGEVAPPGSLIAVGGGDFEEQRTEILAVVGTRIELPRPDKYFLYLTLERPGRLTRLVLSRAPD